MVYSLFCICSHYLVTVTLFLIPSLRSHDNMIVITLKKYLQFLQILMNAVVVITVKLLQKVPALILLAVSPVLVTQDIVGLEQQAHVQVGSALHDLNYL